MKKSIYTTKSELEELLRDIVFEAIQQDRHHFARILLQELGYKPKNPMRRITQAEALRILQPVKIGRHKLDTLVIKGVVTMPDKPGSKRNSQKTYLRDEIYKLLNR